MEAAARTTASRVGRRKAFWRSLPAELGGARFLASTEGGLKYLGRDLARAEPVLTAFATAHVTPGAVVWDVGANVGLFSFMAAGLAGPQGRVVAIEPDTWLVANLRRSAGRNRAGSFAAVDVLPAAVGRTVSVSAFHIAAANRAESYLAGQGSAAGRPFRETQLVPTLTLDLLIDHLPAPDVVKIDVEVAEADVLRGASRLLADVRPVLLIEVSSENAGVVGECLAAARYRMEDADAGDGLAITAPAYTTLAVPEP